MLVCALSGPLNEGEPCDDNTGVYCKRGLHCSDSPGVCAKFCCSDADCNGGKVCDPLYPSEGPFGLCM